jgi:hypothetical protein
MVLVAVSTLLLGLYGSGSSADEPKATMRPIADAESVLAIYTGGLGRRTLILAAWSDGLIVWSGDRVEGGAPYRAGHVDPTKIKALIARLDKDGAFAAEELTRGYVSIDSSFTTMLIKSGKLKLEMSSSHERYESEGLVCTDRGIYFNRDLRKLDVLRERASADYLLFRLVWCETRFKLFELIPDQGTEIKGTALNGGNFYWQEPVSPAKPTGAATPAVR